MADMDKNEAFNPFDPKGNKQDVAGHAGVVEAIKLQNELSDIRLKGTEALEDETIRLQEQNGTLSKHAAALALAALHARQFQEAMADLQAQPYSAEQQKHIATLQANRPVQQAQDTAAGNAGTFSGSMVRRRRSVSNLPQVARCSRPFLIR